MIEILSQDEMKIEITAYRHEGTDHDTATPHYNAYNN